MIALLDHVCKDGKVTLDGCGVVDENNVATCLFRRTWVNGYAVDAEGCGAKFSLHTACGLRRVKDGGPCEACNPAVAEARRESNRRAA